MTAFPDIRSYSLSNMQEKGIEFLIIACDGMWEIFDSDQAVETVHKKVYRNKFSQSTLNPIELSKGLCKVVDDCCARDLTNSDGKGTDNVSTILIEFKKE